MSDKNDFDDAPVPSSDDVFEFGESTILQMRNQPFRVEDQYGTVMSTPLPEVTDTAEEGDATQRTEAETRLVRLEQKLDLALQRIDALQQQLESIDQTLAKALNR